MTFGDGGFDGRNMISLFLDKAVLDPALPIYAWTSNAFPGHSR